MSKVFADTGYWVAVILPNDQWHSAAHAARDDLGDVELVTTQEVLTELLNMMSGRGTVLRDRAARIVRTMHNNVNVTVIPQSDESFLRGLERYENRQDKEYSLTDCVSMNLMDRDGIREALTNDHHFEQEGFTVLMKRVES